MERLAQILCAFDCTVTMRVQEQIIGFTIDSSAGRVGSRRASSGVVNFISTVISAVVQTEDGRLDCSPYRIRCLSGVCAAVVEEGRYDALEALEDERLSR